ncbi:MAG: VTT domain-containing protein [Microbacterium sp.]|uniref:DedA family protein n=1 Tax=Microbacterium sp. TaxID=51671 RepID=UPI0026128FFB|nr:VTT domain-containing protein [Microbacterium sp.]MCX6501713.1 VTT domain-containing protein [Microbacterium sp.]
MTEDAVALASGPWALPAIALLVFADALLVVVPGEVAVTAAGALAVSAGAPPLVAVIAVAAAAAFCGDLCCYAVGRTVGLDRWRWMRHPRVLAGLAWAGTRLQRRTASTLFVARFIPFARLAVTLTAGASRLPALRFAGVTAAGATLWATYQAVIGAAVATLVPGGPIAAILVSITVALALGLSLDAVLARSVPGG